MARWITAAPLFLVLFLLSVTLGVHAQEGRAPDTCVLTGTVTSGGTPLPGVAITIRAGDAAPRMSSTGLDGRFEVPLVAGAPATLTVELTGFTRTERTLEATAGCATPIALQLTVAPRVAPEAPAAGGRGGRG